jgi:hypothetical protein
MRQSCIIATGFMVAFLLAGCESKTSNQWIRGEAQVIKLNGRF